VKALLRADWLRLRRRRDFWVIAIGVCLIGGIGFLSSYRSDVQDPPPFDEAQYRQETIDSGFLDGVAPEEASAELEALVADAKRQDAENLAEWNREQAISLQKYDIVQSPFTLIGSAIVPLVALILMASLAVGDEFRFGTVRTSLLAAGNRRRFLAVRLVSLLALTVGLFVAMALLATLLAIGLRVVGAEVAATTTPIDPIAGAAWFGAEILATMTVLALGTALTLLLRSGALPLLLIIMAALLELFLTALPVFGSGQLLAGVPQAFLMNSIRTLTVRLGLDTHAIALTGVEPPPSAIELPLIVVVAIIAAWAVLFVAGADRRVWTMDIVE
jgi:hypothetical protein